MIEALPGPDGTMTFRWRELSPDEAKGVEAAARAMAESTRADPNVSTADDVARFATLVVGALVEASRMGVPVAVILDGAAAGLLPELQSGAGEAASGRDRTPPQWSAFALATLAGVGIALDRLSREEAGKLAGKLSRLDRGGLLAVAAVAHNIAIGACTCGGRGNPCPTCQATLVRDAIARQLGALVAPNGRPVKS